MNRFMFLFLFTIVASINIVDASERNVESDVAFIKRRMKALNECSEDFEAYYKTKHLTASLETRRVFNECVAETLIECSETRKAILLAIAEYKYGNLTARANKELGKKIEQTVVSLDNLVIEMHHFRAKTSDPLILLSLQKLEKIILGELNILISGIKFHNDHEKFTHDETILLSEQIVELHDAYVSYIEVLKIEGNRQK